MTSRRRSNRLIITIPPDVIDRLKTRGARSDKTHGPYNYTQQLTRTLELYESVVVKSDPRETRELPEDQYDLVLELLQDPQRLESFHIHHLGDYLSELPPYAERARALGLDPDPFAKALNAYTFAEKLHLVDAAQVRKAPAKFPPHRR